ncbi:MAG TPA: hypothetical protein PKA02_04415 [Candidatus Saccharibacteria bacterium]|mgnify:CR=1 FL=1|nr:hypothetical protein [Candidatus Saccharibacteria bacterium]
MKRGEVTLHVPLRDGVIQVGTDAINDVGEISVRKRWRSVTVRNADGSPLQAEVLDEASSHEAVDESARYKRTPVLREPVTEIKFKRGTDPLGTKYWFADGEGVNVSDRDAITRFARVVGKFAVTKQGGKITTRR